MRGNAYQLGNLKDGITVFHTRDRPTHGLDVQKIAAAQLFHSWTVEKHKEHVRASCSVLSLSFSTSDPPLHMSYYTVTSKENIYMLARLKDQYTNTCLQLNTLAAY